jgi:hypothetical protein
MLKLYDHPFSPYAQKVKISLREKDVPFEALMPEGIGAGEDSKPTHGGFFSQRFQTFMFSRLLLIVILVCPWHVPTPNQGVSKRSK